ncbi:hypothetical protein [Enterobacter asburiae]|uniref:hypothetical protein n=1 Tax=Enterobacter asburiae TaxID=61645 RepID=UPI0021CFE1FA|nr:hypothetical protein [Enterobacter asburiae]MCU6239942.1 hypothetical protein [Enterobacter asburiae]
MEHQVCNCAGCGKQHPKSELTYRSSEIYPYRCKYYCNACNLQKEKRDALKNVRTRAAKQSRASYFFKY